MKKMDLGGVKGLTKGGPTKRNTSPKAIAERLIATREALELTQAELCRRLKIAHPTWNNYEAAFRRISPDNAFKVVRVLGVSLDWIYYGDTSLLPRHIISRLPAAMISDGDEES